MNYRIYPKGLKTMLSGRYVNNLYMDGNFSKIRVKNTSKMTSFGGYLSLKSRENQHFMVVQDSIL